ncbi:MAG: hypothetical protein NZ550_02505 [Fimbriimonadales bacterium]|nr:hypothetical protein [Fimbriimonadales bacterium]MDW8052377.1 hypothetical protein [Armatimonadota bacterium]
MTTITRKPQTGRMRSAAVQLYATVPPRPARPKPCARRALLLPAALSLAVITTHLTAMAMLNWETARREGLRREIDRVRLNIERLQGQLAVYTDEVALRQWAERAGMVRVEEQPELTIVELGGTSTPSPPLAMHLGR